MERCAVYRPEARAELAAVVEGADATLLPRGAGRSYGDAALNGGQGVISMVRLDRMLELDTDEAVLECEAGVSLGDVLAAVVPRGFFLPVVPGTRAVTVGGAIASDVHGKNHHVDGSFGRHVESLTLLTAHGQMVRTGPDEYRDLFRATVGGMGLTGVILTARLRLRPLPSTHLSVDVRRAPDLDGTLAELAGADSHHRYSVAWVDGTARGGALGRSVVLRANHAGPERLRDHRLDRVASRTQLSIPFGLPSGALNRTSVQAFNALYYRLRRTRSDRLVPLERFFFPLDGVAHWNRLYGSRGLVQYHAVVPAGAGEGPVRAMLERLVGVGRPPFLAVLKRLGAGSEGLLSFPLEGHSLALDLPRRRGLGKVLAALDRIVLDAGGRVYLAKDASLTRAVFRDMYPGGDRFQAVKEAVDPDGRFSSSQARRLGLAPDRPGRGP